MKKIVCLVLALAMVMALAGTALAASVSASYDNGTLTVSGSVETYLMIWVDGRQTGRSLSPNSPSVSFAYKLDDGSHSIALVNSMTNETVATTSVKVGEDPVVTEAPVTEAPVTEAPVTEAPVTEAPVTEAPVTEAPVVPTDVPTGPLTISATYRNGVITYTVSNLKVPYGELWLDGEATGRSATNGTGTLNKRLSAGNHTLLIYSKDESKSCTFKVEILQPSISFVSYKEVGKLVFSVSNINNPSEIWLDNAAVALSVSADGTYTLNKVLKEGSHTILVYDATNNLRDSASFTVGHIAQKVEGKAPTCTEPGLTDGSVCANPDCGKVLEEQKEIPATGHTPEVVPGKEPTCTETGLTDGSVCSVCGEVLEEQAEIPAKGHTPVAVPGKDATCTETGLTEGSVCSVCDTVLVEQTEIPMIPHTEEVVTGKEPTCTETGLTDGAVCSVCGEVLVEQTEIAALGHNYVKHRANGLITYTCTRCGDTFTEPDPDFKAEVEGYGDILKDTEGVFVPYNYEGNGNILVITAVLDDDYTSEIGMYLDKELIDRIFGEGYAFIEYINGDADIVIELAKISDEWFNTNSAIWCYVFSTDPEAEEGTLVKVEAQISNTEMVPAGIFEGVVLKADEELPISENGIY